MKKNLTVFIALTALGLMKTALVFAEKGQALLSATSTSTTVSGIITLEDTPAGLKVAVSVKQAQPGKHGLHIHEFGDCSNRGNAAGSHYNPMQSPHGHITTDGPHKAHAGDLGNIQIKADGTGTLEAVIPGLTLSNSQNSAGGRAFIFHEKEDDFGQPTGNAGGREACGVIQILSR